LISYASVIGPRMKPLSAGGAYVTPSAGSSIRFPPAASERIQKSSAVVVRSVRSTGYGAFPVVKSFSMFQTSALK
jgi:hypothetical protein